MNKSIESLKGVHFYGMNPAGLMKVLRALEQKGDYFFVFWKSDVELVDAAFLENLMSVDDSWVQCAKSSSPALIENLSLMHGEGSVFLAISPRNTKMGEALVRGSRGGFMGLVDISCELVGEVDFLFHLDFGCYPLDSRPVLLSENDAYIDLFLNNSLYVNNAKKFDSKDFFPIPFCVETASCGTAPLSPLPSCKTNKPIESLKGVHFYDMNPARLMKVLRTLEHKGDYFFVFWRSDVELVDAVFLENLMPVKDNWVQCAKSNSPGLIENLSLRFSGLNNFMAISQKNKKMGEALACSRLMGGLKIIDITCELVAEVDFLFYLDFGYDSLDPHPVLLSEHDAYIDLFLDDSLYINNSKKFDAKDFPSLFI